MRCKVSRFVAFRRPSCVFVDNSFFRSCDAVTGGRRRRERGRLARTTLAKVHPSPRPSSTGSGATIPLGPSPGRCRRQCDRAPHHGETERPPNAEDAGETPAPGARASRPHNTGKGSPISSTELDRQRRHDSTSADPCGCRRPCDRAAASRGNRAATQRRGCGRDARAPGGGASSLRSYPSRGRLLPSLLPLQGVTLPSLLLFEGARGLLAGPQAVPMRCKASGFVALRWPSCVFVENSFFRSCDAVMG